MRYLFPLFVMAGLVPAIHVFDYGSVTTWMRGSSPRMTIEGHVLSKPPY